MPDNEAGVTLSSRDRLACVAALLPMFVYGIAGDYEHPDLPHLGALLAVITCFAGTMARERWAAYCTLVCALTIGFHERMLDNPFNGNDVMLATNEALGVLGSGGDPYAHFYTGTNPPGQPFAYPPGELLFYGLFKVLGGNIFAADRLAAIGTLGVLAALFPLVGPALAALAVSVAALAGPLSFIAANGSNDTAVAFLALVAIALLAGSLAARPPWLARTLWWSSAIAFGWSIAFKETLILVYVPVLAFVYRERRDWRSYALGSLGFAAALILPFLTWNPVGFWQNVVGGLLTHANVWGRNVWAMVTAVSPEATLAIAPLTPLAMLVALGVVAFFCWRHPARELGGAVLQGCALLGALLLFARWTTSTYYAEIAPLLLVGVILAFGVKEPADALEPRAPLRELPPAVRDAAEPARTARR